MACVPKRNDEAKHCAHEGVKGLEGRGREPRPFSVNEAIILQDSSQYTDLYNRYRDVGRRDRFWLGLTSAAARHRPIMAL